MFLNTQTFYSVISHSQNTLLQETYEEWEQCERKLKDIRVWIDKVANNLESIQFKKKPLRDQHGLCEKYLAEINGQKTKITLSIEKLQVIFFNWDDWIDMQTFLVPKHVSLLLKRFFFLFEIRCISVPVLEVIHK